MRRRLLLGLFVLGLTAFSAARAVSIEGLSSEFARRLEQKPVLRAGFVQEKLMPALKKPLILKGQMVLAKGKGVIWRVDSPLPMTYILSATQVVQISPQGERQVFNTRQMPGLGQLGYVITALFEGQYAALTAYFAAEVRDAASGWSLTLKAEKGPMAQAVRRIELQGGRQVDQIRLEEVSGHVSTIRFSNTVEAAALTPAELRLFQE